MGIRSWIKNRFVQVASDDDFLGSVNILSNEEIKRVLKLIGEKVIMSRKFGLDIASDHVRKEKDIVLAMLNFMGGIPKKIDHSKFEEERDKFAREFYAHMSTESLYYFNELSKHLCRQVIEVLRKDQPQN